MKFTAVSIAALLVGAFALFMAAQFPAELGNLTNLGAFIVAFGFGHPVFVAHAEQSNNK